MNCHRLILLMIFTRVSSCDEEYYIIANKLVKFRRIREICCFEAKVAATQDSLSRRRLG
jgi:hypothetical protein